VSTTLRRGNADLVMRAASAGSIPAVQCMPSTGYKGTAHCNRVLPCADLEVAARVGKGHSSEFVMQVKVCWYWVVAGRKKAAFRNECGFFLFILRFWTGHYAALFTLVCLGACLYSRLRRTAASTRGLRRPCSTAITASGFSSGA